MANTSTVLYHRFYDRIAKALDQTKNKVALRQIFAEIISRNNDALSSDIPDKTVFIDKKTGALLIFWDTCGEERFRSVSRQYYKDANGILTAKNTRFINQSV